MSSAIVLVVLSSISLAVTAEQWQEMEWPELMPPEDLEMLETMPQIEHTGDGPPQLPDAIMEGRVRTELDQTPIRIPGFVVPLTASPDQTITEFFLVPYYGACIHVPPPPPNQIIHVTYDDGFQIEALYNPIWIEGVLRTESMSNDVAEASYAVTAESIEPYEEAPSP
ncbi:DUF3299 domain-containing protein [Tamilnaduibacter salinus]|uniref:DUF3299 domain-containing protein n=1 Tax=Tamilnaduibacter salinus TaxID=1484056 RepID=UPI001D17B870|nr:DUF3299 domain-containing protein [Tamilnaduibacter salinus]